jgi:hypothetical protein
MAVSIRFVLSRQVLICIAKIGRTCRLVPSGTGPWSPVGDHFGDQNVRWTFGGKVANAAALMGRGATIGKKAMKTGM